MTTNEMLDQHRPTDAFRDYLEGQVVREFRRRRTFRRLRAAAVIIVSAGVGMTTTLASAQVRDNARRDSLLEAAQSELTLAETRLRLAEAQLAEERKLVAAGAHSTSALAAAELQLHAAQSALEIAVLNTRETELTRLPPLDGLNSPLVRGTDFVMQRLKVRTMLADRQLQVAERLRDEARRRESVGAGTQAEVSEQELEVAKARKALVVRAEQMKARADFLANKAPVKELVERIDRVVAQQEVIVASQALQLAQSTLVLAERKHAVGALGEVEVLRARLAVAERELELKRLADRLKQLRGR